MHIGESQLETKEQQLRELQDIKPQRIGKESKIKSNKSIQITLFIYLRNIVWILKTIVTIFDQYYL